MRQHHDVIGIVFQGQPALALSASTDLERSLADLWHVQLPHFSIGRADVVMNIPKVPTVPLDYKPRPVTLRDAGEAPHHSRRLSKYLGHSHETTSRISCKQNKLRHSLESILYQANS